MAASKKAASNADQPEPSDLADFYENRDIERDGALADSPAEVGARIAEARTNAAMSRDELGQHLGVRSATVARWERGGSTPRPNHLDLMAGLLGVSLTWLVMGRGEAPADDELDELRQELAAVRHSLHDALAAVDRMALRLGPPST